MKHYIDTTGTEFACYIEPSWKGMKRIQRKSRSAAKHSYRRRERAALKRSLAAEVEAEVELMELAESDAADVAYIAESVSFWMDECIDAYEEVESLRRELAEAEHRLAEAEILLDFWEKMED